MYADMKMMTIALAVAMSPFVGEQAKTLFGAIATAGSQGQGGGKCR